MREKFLIIYSSTKFKKSLEINNNYKCIWIWKMLWKIYFTIIFRKFINYYFCHRSGMIIFNNLILLKNILYILQNYLYKFVLLLMNYRLNLYIKVYRNAINLYRNFMEINFMEINFCWNLYPDFYYLFWDFQCACMCVAVL